MRYIYLCVLLSFSNLVFAENTKEINAYDVLSKKPKIDFQSQVITKKPELEDFSSYNEFLQAMYFYNKNEEQTFKPDIVITLPSKGKSIPEYSPVDAEKKDVTAWGEDMPTLNPQD